MQVASDSRNGGVALWFQSKRVFQGVQFNQHVQRGTSGILEGITDGIPNDASFVGIALLTKNDAIRVQMVNYLTRQAIGS